MIQAYIQGLGGSGRVELEEEYIELKTAGSGVFSVPNGTLFIRGFMVGGGQGGMNADNNYAAGGLGGDCVEFCLPVSGEKEIPYYVGKGGVNGGFTDVTRFGENTWFNTENNFAFGGKTPKNAENYPPGSSWRQAVLNYQYNTIRYSANDKAAGLLDGMRNPLNPNDTSLYGAVGGSGFGTGGLSGGGGVTGSGSGGKRGDVGQTTAGTDATFYGAGGGGGGKRDGTAGAGSPGGKGYQGIIILKLYKRK